MFLRRSSVGSAVALLLSLVIGGPSGAAEYSVTDLGTLGGATSDAEGINNSGQVVGSAFLSSGQKHAFLYSNGTMADLGTLGGTSSAAWGVNDGGQVVGGATTVSSGYAFVYSNGTMTELPTPSGLAYAINGSGQIVGNAGGQAFLYANATTVNLGGLPGGSGSAAYGINDNGQVVGSTTFVAAGTGATRESAFVYSNGTMTEVATCARRTSPNATTGVDPGRT